MKTGTIFRSDDEYWAWLERRERMYERLYRAARYVAVLSAAALVLFSALYFLFRSMGAGHYNAWSEALNSCRSPGG